MNDRISNVLAEMLGPAETDCLDDKSNVWRSAMIDARAALAECGTAYGNADEAQREEDSNAVSARLALTLFACMRCRAIDDTDQKTGETFRELARGALDAFRDMLRFADCQRDLTETEAEALAAIAVDIETKPRALPVYTLAEVRNGTGWPRGQRFTALPDGAQVAYAHPQSD